MPMLSELTMRSVTKADRLELPMSLKRLELEDLPRLRSINSPDGPLTLEALSLHALPGLAKVEELEVAACVKELSIKRMQQIQKICLNGPIKALVLEWLSKLERLDGVEHLETPDL